MCVCLVAKCLSIISYLFKINSWKYVQPLVHHCCVPVGYHYYYNSVNVYKAITPWLHVNS